MAEVSKKIAGTITIPQSLISRIANVAVLEKEFQSTLQKGATEILEVVFGGGFSLAASDIHVEPGENGAKIRFRLDGMLQEVLSLGKETYSTFLSRIKLIAGLKLNITDRPQDGRFSILIGPSSIEIRVSTLPSEYGESIVMRILNPKSLISLKELGLREDLLKIFARELKKPNGMIIATGPTGSGKTTTLYAFLKEIQKPEIKIITIEDPIEYHLSNISQTQVAPEKGYNFASGLKSIVRQDPDVILVGEIRDLETANISLQAALTGHLVLSTLHTNDASGTIARLANLGAKLADIGPAINLAIAQRLVRKICKKCAGKEKISPATLAKIKQTLKGLPKTVNRPKFGPSTMILKSSGCKDCNFTGYKGRVGLYEAFLVNDQMEKFILENPSTAALKGKAIKQGGMATIAQDGAIKVLEGITTLEEVERVAGQE